MKAKMVMHHDDPPCEERLVIRDGGRYCPACRLHLDMQSLCLWSYCPECDEPLKKMECSKCGQIYERPSR